MAAITQQGNSSSINIRMSAVLMLVQHLKSLSKAAISVTLALKQQEQPTLQPASRALSQQWPACGSAGGVAQTGLDPAQLRWPRPQHGNVLPRLQLAEALMPMRCQPAEAEQWSLCGMRLWRTSARLHAPSYHRRHHRRHQVPSHQLVGRRATLAATALVPLPPTAAEAAVQLNQCLVGEQGKAQQMRQTALQGGWPSSRPALRLQVLPPQPSLGRPSRAQCQWLHGLLQSRLLQNRQQVDWPSRRCLQLRVRQQMRVAQISAERLRD